MSLPSPDGRRDGSEAGQGRDIPPFFVSSRAVVRQGKWRGSSQGSPGEGWDVFCKNCPRPLSNSPPPLKKRTSGRSGRSPSLSGGEGFSVSDREKDRLPSCHACCLIEEGSLRHARRKVTRRLTSPYPAVRLFLHLARLPGGVARLSARSFLFSATRHPLTNAAKNEKRTS